MFEKQTSKSKLDKKQSELLLVDFVKSLLPNESVTLVKARFGYRINLGPEVPLRHTNWTYQYSYAKNYEDMVGRYGFLTFYSGTSIDWKGPDFEHVKFGNYLQFMTICCIKNSFGHKGFTAKFLNSVPDWAKSHRISLVMQEVENIKLLNYFMTRPQIWTPSKISTNQGINDWSFYYKCS